MIVMEVSSSLSSHTLDHRCDAKYVPSLTVRMLKDSVTNSKFTVRGREALAVS